MRGSKTVMVAVAAMGLIVAACGNDGAGDEQVVEPPPTVQQPTESTPVETDSAPTSEPTPATTTPENLPAEELDVVSVTVFTSAEGLSADRVGGVVVGVDGTVWATTEGDAPGSNDGPRFESYARFDGSQFVDIGFPDLAVLDGPEEAFEDGVFGMDAAGGPDETLWLANTGFGSIGDVYHYDGTEWSSPVTRAASLIRGEAAPDGSLWSISMAGATVDDNDEVVGIGVVRIDDEGIEPQPLPDGGIPCGFCVEYGFDADGTLWMASEHGLFGFDGDVWTPATAELPELDGFGFAIGEGRWVLGADGSHWYLSQGDLRADGDGGDTYHLTRYDGDEVVTVPLTLEDAVIDRACIAEQFDVEVETITDDAIAQFDGRLSVGFKGLAGDREGDAWIALECSGLYRIDVVTGAATRFGLEEGLPSLSFRAVTAHPDGSVWVATNAGLARIEPGA